MFQKAQKKGKLRNRLFGRGLILKATKNRKQKKRAQWPKGCSKQVDTKERIGINQNQSYCNFKTRSILTKPNDLRISRHSVVIAERRSFVPRTVNSKSGRF